ncbi:MAG: cobalt transporter CbiM [Bacillota bacterium]
MHISEGVVSAPVLITGFAFGASGVAVGLKKLNNEQIPKVAIITSALFVGSLIHIPVGPTSVHLILSGIAGILLGWSIFPALLVALFLQAVLFQHGGLTVLGVNLVNAAVPGIIAFYLYKLILKKRADNRKVLGIGIFFCNLLAVFLTVLMAVFSLVVTNREAFTEIAGFVFITHLPVMFVEGLLGAFCILFIQQISPEILTEG